MDIGEKPKFDPSRSHEMPKSIEEALTPSDKSTNDVAADFFEGFESLFQEPEQKTTVAYTSYSPTLPVSSNYAKRAMEHLMEGLDKKNYGEEIGVLSESGAVFFDKKEDVDINKKVGSGQVVFKHVGNAVILIFPEELRKILGPEGVERYKDLMLENLKTSKRPLVPREAIQILTLQTKDWEMHIPNFFTKMQTLLPVVPVKDTGVQKGATKVETKAVSSKAQAPAKKMPATARQTASKETPKAPRKAFPERSEVRINKLGLACIEYSNIFQKERKALTEISQRRTLQEQFKSQRRGEDLKSR